MVPGGMRKVQEYGLRRWVARRSNRPGPVYTVSCPDAVSVILREWFPWSWSAPARVFLSGSLAEN